MRLEAFIVNAFAEELAEGNPAGVVISGKPLSDDDMKKIAFGIGKSETAFLIGKYPKHSIRWFSSVREMPLCGHATLAASKVLFEKDESLKEINFSYASGEICVSRDECGGIGMVFPLDGYDRIKPEQAYLDFFAIDRVLDCIQGKATKKVVLVLEKSADLRAVKPDYGRMLRFNGEGRNGIGITKLSEKYDFETRYFNPWAGVNEDPVTGSVHTVLANYWKNNLGKNILRAYQDSQRPGLLRLNVLGDKVEITGKARIFLRGEIRL